MPGVSLLEELHSACTKGLDGVEVDTDAVAQVAARLKPDDVRAAARGAFPVKFESIEDEITFLAICRLLDFGSEYDALLRAAVGRDARGTMQFGELGLHIGGKRLDRHFLKDFSLFSVTNYFSFEGRVDHELQPGITISKPGPLQPLAEAIKGTLNAAGEALEKLGQRTLGGHVLAFVDARKAAGEPALAAALVADLVASFPGFADVVHCGDTRVPFNRKAQALAGDLYARFGAPSSDAAAAAAGAPSAPDARFAWEDAERLAGDSGALAAAAWRGLGVVKLPERLAAEVDAGTSLSADDACAVRAGAVAAADAVAVAVPGVSPAQLSAWAESLMDEGGELHGKVKAHVSTGTTTY